MSLLPGTLRHPHAAALVTPAQRIALAELADGRERRLSRSTSRTSGRVVNARAAEGLADLGLVMVTASLTGSRFAKITDNGVLVHEALGRIEFVRTLANGRVHLIAPWRGVPAGLPDMTAEEADVWALATMSVWTRCGQVLATAGGRAERVTQFPDEALCARCMKTVQPDEVERVFAADRTVDGSEPSFD